MMTAAFLQRRDQRDHVADVIEDAVRADIGGRAGSPKALISGATTWKPAAASAGFDAARNRIIPAAVAKQTSGLRLLKQKDLDPVGGNRA